VADAAFGAGAVAGQPLLGPLRWSVLLAGDEHVGVGKYLVDGLDWEAAIDGDFLVV
jgi:hypothetical protein